MSLLKKELTLKRFSSLEEVINKPYSKVTIELKNDYDLDEIKKLLSNKGETEINLLIRNKNRQALFSLQENRKFDLSHLKALKSRNMLKK